MQLLVRGEVAALAAQGCDRSRRPSAHALEKELAKADADIKRVDAKLGNEKFVANAPEEVVEEEKEKREEAEGRKAKILEALEAAERRRVRNAAGRSRYIGQVPHLLLALSVTFICVRVIVTPARRQMLWCDAYLSQSRLSRRVRYRRRGCRGKSTWLCGAGRDHAAFCGLPVHEIGGETKVSILLYAGCGFAAGYGLRRRVSFPAMRRCCTSSLHPGYAAPDLCSCRYCQDRRERRLSRG